VADVELGSVRIVMDLHQEVEAVRALGFRILTHWSGVPAVSEADAYALTRRQQMLGEQYDQQHREMVEAQQAWHVGRQAAYRSAYAEAARGRQGGEALAGARQAGLKAMIGFERANDPTKLGLPAALRTDPAMVDREVADASRWGPVAEAVS
jgi:hypothetical protein